MVTAADAADQTLSIPTGWTASPYRFAASAQRSAFILYPAASNPYLTSSKIMIAATSGAPVFAELTGKAFAISQSPNGSYVLVHQDGPDARRVTLLSATTGATVWTKSNDNREFAFSATGSALFAHKVQGESAAGNVVEVFDLAGAMTRRVSFDTTITSAVVADDGSQVVVAMGRTVSAFRFPGGSTVTEWSMNLGGSDEPISQLRSLGPDRFLVLQELGHFKVVRWSGTVEYTYNPAALDAADPARSFEDYASYEVYPTPLANKLLLFRNSPDALILNLTTGALTSKSIDIAAPQGFSLMNLVESNRIVFNSATQLRVRSISY